jgi:hypothetical protein
MKNDTEALLGVHTPTRSEYDTLQTNDTHVVSDGTYESPPAAVDKVAQHITYVLSETWRGASACKNAADLFFPKEGEERWQRMRREERATDCCNNTCSVKNECLDLAAIGNEKDGIWGGLTGKGLKSAVASRRIELGFKK